jgi:large subunit ribosomal protein L9
MPRKIRRERQNMKVVLRKDVEKLGDAGTVQNVADGYARNYLIPKGFAVVATTGELKVVAENTRVKEMKTARQERQLQDLADKISGQRLNFTARSGDQGRLYGSITAGDIAERLTAAVGQEIDRRKVVLEDPIRHTGEHNVSVHLVGRLRPQVTVIVTGEREEEVEASPPLEDATPTEPIAEE